MHIHETTTERQTAVVLGYTPMDDIHAEFTDLMRSALSSTDSEFAALLESIAAHLRSHFSTEDQWMRDTEFPAADCHIDEHAAVLRSADEVLALPETQRIAVGRAFVEELDRWFPPHADYLDSALAAWMCKRALGARPVVFHRGTGS